MTNDPNTELMLKIAAERREQGLREAGSAVSLIKRINEDLREAQGPGHDETSIDDMTIIHPWLWVVLHAGTNDPKLLTHILNNLRGPIFDADDTYFCSFFPIPNPTATGGQAVDPDDVRPEDIPSSEVHFLLEVHSHATKGQFLECEENRLARLNPRFNDRLNPFFDLTPEDIIGAWNDLAEE